MNSGNFTNYLLFILNIYIFVRVAIINLKVIFLFYSCKVKKKRLMYFENITI